MSNQAIALEQGLTEDYGPVVAEIIKRGDIAIEQYSSESAVAAGSEFSRLYFDVFEGSGMEFTLGLKDQSLMQKVEFGFSQMINLSMQVEDAARVTEIWSALKIDLQQVVARYPGGAEVQSFWGLVLQSFLILFREGVEAMLVVAALVAYLRRAGYADKVKVIWQGVVLALIASVLTAWLLNNVFELSGAGRETLEGVTMLIAAAVLLYVSYWLFAKGDAERWQAFIRHQMDQAISRGSLFALAMVAFLAVFREGAETILFYQALISSSSGEMNAVWAGMGLAGLLLVGTYMLVRLASLRIPMGLFFSCTAALLFIMAFVFTGKGLLELQISGLVSVTQANGFPQVGWLGLFPTWETMLGQFLVLAMLPLGWLLTWMNRDRSLAR